MKYKEEFGNKNEVKKYIDRIKTAVRDRAVTVMEVCGTHTMAISRFGFRSIFPENLNLISGPGCPVCVTPNSFIDCAVALARNGDVIVATFGDMLRVPGSTSSLDREKSMGGDVRIVYSTMEALKIADTNPQKKVVFLGVGFETTAPTIAASILTAKKSSLTNYHVLCAHKVMPPAMEALVTNDRMRIDGFICPGHVSTVIGSVPYRFLADKYNKACVITGFEPIDICQSVEMLVNQIINSNPRIEIQYTRSVRPEGNTKAMTIMDEVFEPCDSEWRGIGEIKGSGLKIRDTYGEFDAENAFEIEPEPVCEHPECLCGNVLQGIQLPIECVLFGSDCTPEHPVGACMVSNEGTCAAYYKYECIDNIV